MSIEREKSIWFEQYPEILYADGYDEAILGIANQCGESHLVYDRKKCIDIIVERDGMTWEDAEEFFEFNVAGAYVGEFAPFFVELIKDIS